MTITHFLAVLVGLAAIAVIAADAYAHLDPRTGRFIERDTGGGDQDGLLGNSLGPGPMRRPRREYADGMNLYQYTRGSPIVRRDPTGQSSRDDIPHRLEYSCNCGWIDWGHAKPSSARRLWSDIQSHETDPDYRGPYELEGVTGYFVSYSQTMVFVSEGRGYVIRYGLTTGQKESVALAIFRDTSRAFEAMQSGLPWSIVTDSGFSEEDLTSDEIGFYMAVRGYTKERIKELCKTVGKDRSLAVWDAAGGLGKNESFDHWIHHQCAGCDENSARWPKELSSIDPATPGRDFASGGPGYNPVADEAAELLEGVSFYP